MVVDAIIHNRVKVINGEEEEPEGFGLAVQCIAELFYADDKLLSSPRPDFLQEALNVLGGIFDQFGFLTNVKKIVGMAFQKFWTAVRNSEAAYRQHMTGGGFSY